MWKLARLIHSVTVYDDAAQIGGKLAQVIPHSGISQDLFKAELNRIEKIGVHFVTGCKVDAAKFSEICDTCDAVLIAVGGNKARYFNWEGAELLTFGVDFLKAINRGDKPHVGKNVVGIGGGNSGMDVATSAYEQGAESVVVVDAVKPAVFAKKIRRLENFGGRIFYPFTPVLDFLPEVKKFRDWLVTDAEKKFCRKSLRWAMSLKLFRPKTCRRNFLRSVIIATCPTPCMSTCAGVCPCGVWNISDNPAEINMYRTYDAG